jgi:hypothetical protein
MVRSMSAVSAYDELPPSPDGQRNSFSILRVQALGPKKAASMRGFFPDFQELFQSGPRRTVAIGD